MKAHLDLCSGIGGFGLAARWAGLTTIQFVEIEPFCQAVLVKHWPETPIHGDLRTFDARPFRGRVFLLTAGFPCQDISAAGKGAGLSGERSSLWWQVRRVIRECRPVFCLIENVPMLKHRGIDTVLFGLERAGYTPEAHVVGADDVGAPHQRKRVWIVAYSRHVSGWQEWASDGRGDAQSIRRTVTCSPDGSSRELGNPNASGDTVGISKSRKSEFQGQTTISDYSFKVMADTQSRGAPTGQQSGQLRGDISKCEVMADANETGRFEPDGGKSGGQELPSSERGGETMAYSERSAEQQQADYVLSGGDQRDARFEVGQLRERISRDGELADTDNTEQGRLSSGERAQDAVSAVECGSMADSARNGQRWEERAEWERTRQCLPTFPPARNDYGAWATIAELDASLMPCVERDVCDVDDGISARLVRRRRRARNATLKGLGNSIVPQVAYLFIMGILASMGKVAA